MNNLFVLSLFKEMSDLDTFTSSWKDWLTLTNWNGLKGDDFLSSRVRWMGNLKNKNFSQMALQDIARSNICLLAYSFCIGYHNGICEAT